MNSPCVWWIGAINSDGYGNMRHNGRVESAHRVFYEAEYGPVPDGFELDHLCRHRACVNPDHLEAVPHLTNVERGARAQQKTCTYGHSEWYRRKSRRGRICRPCALERARKQHELRQQKAAA